MVLHFVGNLERCQICWVLMQGHVQAASDPSGFQYLLPIARNYWHLWKQCRSTTDMTWRQGFLSWPRRWVQQQQLASEARRDKNRWRPGFFLAPVGFFLCPQPVWMEGSPAVVCTSGVVCRDGGHLSALCRLVSLLHVDRGGVLQALCRHAGFESNPALQRHGPTKILATLFGGFESDLTGRGKVRKKPCKHFWRV